MANLIRTSVLLVAMTALMLVIGQLLGGNQGMVIALILAGVMNFVSYWYSDKIVLKMYQAREIKLEDDPDLYGIVSRLAQRAGLPMPKLFIIPQDTPNAFATGRNPDHAVVAVTKGLLNLLDEQEITGVLAHELAHVKNRDILIGSIAATMAGAIMVLASMARWGAIFGGGRSSDDENGSGIIGLIVLSIIAPVAAMIIQMAISRSREYLADKTGAQVSGNPEGLARALEKLGAYSKRLPMQSNPSTAHIFTVSPLSGSSLMTLFSTHPPLENRIVMLRRGSGTGDKTSVSTPREQNRQSQAEDFWERLR
ncbi:zinc metalloprotease HtpX [Desulfobacula sp.]|uniref:zinc metalloprotease HtpX n=1 Tax=Desulfobacula sp. TaxID=2593537 RepID=UPI002624EE61|nr:zinc metalloprotease HtpX [Desulfobacula sp.]